MHIIRILSDTLLWAATLHAGEEFAMLGSDIFHRHTLLGIILFAIVHMAYEFYFITRFFHNGVWRTILTAQSDIIIYWAIMTPTKLLPLCYEQHGIYQLFMGFTSQINSDKNSYGIMLSDQWRS